MSNMKNLNERLQVVENHVNDGNITVMIIGLGSVGTYLLDFLVSKNDPSIKIIVVGRNYEKMESIEAAARINTPADPASVEARDEILRKRSFMMLSITKKVNISKNVTRLFKI